MNNAPPRLLFVSPHSYVDPSSGAAMAMRDVLELMAARGWECRAFTAGLLDYDADTPYTAVLAALGLPYDEVRVALGGGGEAMLYDLMLNQVAGNAGRFRLCVCLAQPDALPTAFVHPHSHSPRGRAMDCRDREALGRSGV